MTKNFEKRRNEFMHSFRNEIYRRSSLMPPAVALVTKSFSSGGDRSSSLAKLPPIKSSRVSMISRPSHPTSKFVKPSLAVAANTLIASLEFHQNLKNLIGFKHLRKVKDLFMLKELTITVKSSTLDQVKAEVIRHELEMIKLKISARERFRKAIKLVLSVIKMISIHKVSKEKIRRFGKEIKIDLVADENMFDPKAFGRPQEPAFPEEAKKMLGVASRERTEDMLRYIMISLNFSVPEFSELPFRIQKMWAQRAFYQEFEPDRVIVRQGHYPAYYYMVVSGKALVIEATTETSSTAAKKKTDDVERRANGELSDFNDGDSAIKNDEDDLIYTPLSSIKRGDCFGESEIINNKKRASSIKVSGNKPLCLLCVDKEDFFVIQGSKSSKDKINFLKSNVPLLNRANYPFESVELENAKRQTPVCFSRYYRNGVVICADSQRDEWIYIIKSGSCKLFKRIQVGKESVERYWHEHRVTRRRQHLKRIEYLFDAHRRSEYYQPNLIPSSSHSPLPVGLIKDVNFDAEVVLELPKLNNGDVFALNDAIFDRDLDDYKCSLMLVSEGVECILINRHVFLKHLSPQAWFILRVNSTIYPNDQYFVNKYINSYVWNDYKKGQLNYLLNKINVSD